MTKPKTFLDRVMAGEKLDIDDFVGKWHEGGSGLSLDEYLGMRVPEYAAWFEGKLKIEDIVRYRKMDADQKRK